MNGHKTTIVERRSDKESFGIRVCVSIDLGTNVTGPVTVVTDVFKVALVDQVIFHVAEHRGRTGSHAASSETSGVKLNVWVDGSELHDGGEVSRHDGGEESTISGRREIGDIVPKDEYDVKGLTVDTGITMCTTVGRATSEGGFGSVLEDVKIGGGLTGRKDSACNSGVKTVVVFEAEEGMMGRDMMCVRAVVTWAIAGSR